jgi:hypothetical protein
MRKFSPFEKDVIKLVAEIKLDSNETFSRFLQHKYFTSERKQALLIKHDTQDVLFYMSPEVFNSESKRAQELKNFWTLISLIQYLIEQRYISNIPIQGKTGLDYMYEEFDSTAVSKGNKLILNSNGDYLITSKPDEICDSTGKLKLKGILWNDLYSSISENLLGIIFPSEGVKYLVENEFKSEEDKRYNIQLRLTWLGIFLSGLLGGYSIFSDINNSEKQNGFELEIMQKAKTIEIETKDLNKNIIEGVDSITKAIINKNKVQTKKNKKNI